MVSKIAQLEERVERMERELHRLRDARLPKPKTPWWERIVGDYADDDTFDEMIELGAEWRRQQREP